MTNLVPRNAPDCDGRMQQRLSVSAVFPSVDWYLLRKHNDRALFERYLLFVGTGGTFTTCILWGYCIAFQATTTKMILLLCSTEHSSDCNYWTITGKQWCEIFELTVPQWMKITSKFRQNWLEIASKLRRCFRHHWCAFLSAYSTITRHFLKQRRLIEAWWHIYG